MIRKLVVRSIGFEGFSLGDDVDGISWIFVDVVMMGVRDGGIVS
jgi:hypothetical protein